MYKVNLYTKMFENASNTKKARPGGSYPYNSSSHEAEAKSTVEEFKASLGCSVRPHAKQTKPNQTKTQYNTTPGA